MVEVAGRYSNVPRRLEALLSQLGTWVRVDRLPFVVRRQVRVEERLGPEQVADLIGRYRGGVSTPELALRFGIGTTAVKSLLRRQGVVLRARGFYHPRGSA